MELGLSWWGNWWAAGVHLHHFVGQVAGLVQAVPNVVSGPADPSSAEVCRRLFS